MSSNEVTTEALEGLDFVAIDVETANGTSGTICQVGMARFVDGKLAETFETLVNPMVEFSAICTRIHGIKSHDIVDAPLFAQARNLIGEFAGDKTLVCHSHFDRVAVQRACHQHEVAHFSNPWLDTARLARRTWDSAEGYGLKALCTLVGHQLERHHNALQDAVAAGQILVACCRHKGIGLSDLPKIVSARVTSSRSGYGGKVQIKQTGDPDGIFAGELICFTGALRVVRSEAATLAARSGFDVTDSINQRTTVLVIGDDDVQNFGGEYAGNKMRKAAELIEKGFPLRVVGETEFFEMVGTG